MEFVNKTTEGRRWSHPILKRFLDRCREKTPYPENLYDEMKDDIEPDHTLNPAQKSTYRLLLEGILNESDRGNTLPQGTGLCCYCMRRIDAASNHSTLEHVIPKSVTDAKTYARYYDVPSSLERDDRIMVPKQVFVTRNHYQAPPFPHNVAYENLVASCDGSLPKGSTTHLCCNGPRDDHYIPPIAFIPNIHNQIKYKKNGVVVWKENPDVDSRERKRVITDELHLNCSILRMIRLVWNYLSERQMDCTLNEQERRRVIDTLRPQCFTIDKEVLQNFHFDIYWCLLDEYRYFNDTTIFSE